MKTVACTVAAVVNLALLCGCRHHVKDDRVLENLGPPDFNLTGAWSASWQDPRRKTSEAFTMDMVQQGPNVTGTAVFMDANGTRADITGQAGGSKIRLLMSPQPTAPFHVIPETSWIGTVTNKTVSGTWYFHGRAYRGYASTGPWSAVRRE